MYQLHNKITDNRGVPDTLEKYRSLAARGKFTPKGEKLWQFVLSAYGGGEFTTKQLERDFGNAAYATIRSFVMKFTELGLMSAVKMSNRVKYKIN